MKDIKTVVEINEIENGKIIKEKSIKTKPFFKDNKMYTSLPRLIKK